VIGKDASAAAPSPTAQLGTERGKTFGLVKADFAHKGWCSPLMGNSSKIPPPGRRFKRPPQGARYEPLSSDV